MAAGERLAAERPRLRAAKLFWTDSRIWILVPLRLKKRRGRGRLFSTEDGRRVDIQRPSPHTVGCVGAGAKARARAAQDLTTKAREGSRQSRLLRSKALSGLRPPKTSPTQTHVLFLTRP